ncbi:MAG: hypothetical protein IJS70_10130 [Bacteroidales bacterium]|nr:hypothetical protein [Bacteroidales bacterium]
MKRFIVIIVVLFPVLGARAGGYFEGWYFKLQSGSQTMALIVAHHRTNSVNSASLQVITDDTVWNIPFDYADYSRLGSGLDVHLGDNHFSAAGIHLDIHEAGLDLTGDIAFGPWTPLKGDIMGPFTAVPFMQCRHSVWSVEHTVNGAIFLNDVIYDFTDSRSYIEGDRGYSFPSVYIWTQSLIEDGSIMLSVADIPMGLFHFTGIIGFVYYKGKEYRLATYNGARVIMAADNTAIIRCKDMELTARLVHKNAQPLYAPLRGAMNRVIRESAT